jgi:hypothetical protein
MIMSGCTIFRHNRVLSTASATGPAPSAEQLISQLQQNFRTVKSFHVKMQIQNAGPVDPNQVQILSAEGDVIMPDKVDVQAKVALSGQNAQVHLISADGKQYVTNPVTGKWDERKDLLDPGTLTNPDTGVISVITKMQNPSKPLASNANGAPCWSIKGTSDAQNLALFTGGGAPAGSQLQVSACIGQKDSLPYYLSIVGQAGRGDTPQTNRTFDLFNYNEKITINKPQA